MRGSENVPEIMKKVPTMVLNVPLKPSHTSNPNLSRIWKMNEEQKSAGGTKPLREITEHKNKSLSNRVQEGRGEALRNSSTPSLTPKSNLVLATDFRSHHYCTDIISDVVTRNMPKSWDHSPVSQESIAALPGPAWALCSLKTGRLCPCIQEAYN